MSATTGDVSSATPLILVIGMHRSGTSAATAVLGKLGVGMPATHMAVNEGNPKGYWESVPLHDFHERLLHASGSRWNDWTELRLVEAPGSADELVAVLRQEFDLDRICAVKDPRICRMVPFWLRATEKSGHSPRFLIPYRHPLEVAASLVQRGGGMTREEGLLLWLRHVLDAEAATRGQPRVFFRYERLIDDWRGTVARIAGNLRIDWPVPPAEAADDIDAFLDVGLRRQIVRDPESGAAFPWIADTCAALDALADDARDPLPAQAELDRIRSEFNYMCAMFGPSLHSMRAAYEIRLSSSAAHVARLEASLAAVPAGGGGEAPKSQEHAALAENQTTGSSPEHGTASPARGVVRTLFSAFRRRPSGRAWREGRPALSGDEYPAIIPAVTLPADGTRVLALPLGYEVEAAPRPSIAVLLHLYYAELGPELRDVLTVSMAGGADLYVTTDTPEKLAALRQCFEGWPHGSVEVRLLPNRGRDVAPRIVGLADVHERYDLCLHLHGKKSPHWKHGEAWRHDLLARLAGDRQVVGGVIETFRRWPRLGIVMPRIFAPVLSAVSWGYDLDRCARLGARLGIPLSRASPLHFPAGSMFWCRRGALGPLLDLRLSYDDFEPEDGLPHGSLAHAIERMMLHICERAGFHWLEVGPAGETAAGSPVAARSPEELDKAVSGTFLLLTDPALNPSGTVNPGDQMQARFRPDREAPSRLTLILGPNGLHAGPGLPTLIARFDAMRGPARTRIVLGERVDAGDILAFLPPDIEVVRLSRHGLKTTLALGANDVLLASEGPAADLARRLSATAEQLGQAVPQLSIVDAKRVSWPTLLYRASCWKWKVRRAKWKSHST